MSGKKVLLNENKYGLRRFLKQALLVFGSAVGSFLFGWKKIGFKWSPKGRTKKLLT
jgi:hypothetical protein